MPQRSRIVSTTDAVTVPAAGPWVAPKTWLTRSAKIASAGRWCSVSTAPMMTSITACSTVAGVVMAGRPGIGRSNNPANPWLRKRSL
jgi:hypothetical protein